MRLSFDFSYEDYADSENWLPRLEELKAIAAEEARTDLTGLSDKALLDRMEDIEELMRYYTAIADYRQLEAVMRLDYRLIQEGDRRGLICIPFEYFRLEFERVNAMLYRSEGQHRKALEGYHAAWDIAVRCSTSLQQDIKLMDKQKLYIGWACAEVMSETAQAYDAISEHFEALVCCRHTVSLLEWLKSYMGGYAGIQDKAAELYCSYGGVFFQSGDLEKGRVCYQNAVSMFAALDREYGSDFWYARSLWAMSHYGLQEFLCAGDADIMLTCEQRCRAALDARFTDEREIAIAEAALALILLQKGLGLQQGGNLSDAIEQTKQGIDLCKSSLGKLEQDADRKGMHYRLVIGSITTRLFASYIGAVDSLGVQLYSANRYDEAKEVLQEALVLLGKQSDYGISEVAATMVRAECLNYLAFVSTEEGNADAVEFYAEQSVAQTSNIIGKVNNPGIARIQSYACSLLSEYYLNTKNKPKALQYAEIGLAACAEWQRLEPQGGQPGLVSLLEKYKKKASRWLF